MSFGFAGDVSRRWCWRSEFLKFQRRPFGFIVKLGPPLTAAGHKPCSGAADSIATDWAMDARGA